MNNYTNDYDNKKENLIIVALFYWMVYLGQSYLKTCNRKRDFGKNEGKSLKFSRCATLLYLIYPSNQIQRIEREPKN